MSFAASTCICSTWPNPSRAVTSGIATNNAVWPKIIPASEPSRPKNAVTKEIETAKTIPGRRKGRLTAPTRDWLSLLCRRHISSAVASAMAVAKTEETTAISTLLKSELVQLGSAKKFTYQFIEGSWGGKAICRGPLNEDPNTTKIGVYKNTPRPVRAISLGSFNRFSAKNELSNCQTQQYRDEQAKRQRHSERYVERSHKVRDEHRKHPV